MRWISKTLASRWLTVSRSALIARIIGEEVSSVCDRIVLDYSTPAQDTEADINEKVESAGGN